MNNEIKQPIQERCENEISLLEIYHSLVEKKTILISTVVAALLGAIAYLVVIPSTYEANVRLLSLGTTSHFLATTGDPYTVIDAKTAFDDFYALLNSREQWRRFVSAQQDLIPDLRRDNQAGVLAGVAMRTALVSALMGIPVRANEHPIKFSKAKNHLVEYIDLSYRGNEAKLSAEVLRRYLEFTREIYTADLLEQTKDRVEHQRKTVSAEISLLRQKARQLREDEIARLRNDLILAHDLGITDNLLVNSNGSDIATNGTMHNYMFGTKVLNARIEYLLKRKSDDPYISELRDYQLELNRLNVLWVTPLQLKLYIQDGDVITIEYPTMSRKVAILVLSIVFGCFLGLVLVLMASTFRKTQIQHSR